jgi:hypothetical protein
MRIEKDTISSELRRISDLKEFDLDWPDSDRLRVCRVIATEMQSGDTDRIQEWSDRLRCLASESARFINDNQAFIVAGYGQLNDMH